jgi:hypothetical protein
MSPAEPYASACRKAPPPGRATVRFQARRAAVIQVIEDQITTLLPYNARYTSDYRSFFEKIRGDDHPCITRSVRLKSCGAPSQGQAVSIVLAEVLACRESGTIRYGFLCGSQVRRVPRGARPGPPPTQPTDGSVATRPRGLATFVHGGRHGVDGVSLIGSAGVQPADGGVSRLVHRPRYRCERHVTRRPPRQTA